ncbi:uncharacterized protein V1516DRAFT_677301 [Lipomyces oligophaga]|uniref:uncharacterized protein n=1 Tax=Lipomyces oligophaga TaxID=45792 RepID=UPI0034CFDAF8
MDFVSDSNQRGRPNLAVPPPPSPQAPAPPADFDQPGAVRFSFLAAPFRIHLLCGLISSLFAIFCSRVLGRALQFILDQPESFSAYSPTATALPGSLNPSDQIVAGHVTLIDKFVYVFQEEFSSSSSAQAGPSPTDAFLFRLCGVLLYTIYALVIAFALSFSALFHSFFFIFYVWRKWIGLGQGLYGVWNSDAMIQGVW